MEYKSKVSIIQTDKLTETQKNYSQKDVKVVRAMLEETFDNCLSCMFDN